MRRALGRMADKVGLRHQAGLLRNDLVRHLTGDERWRLSDEERAIDDRTRNDDRQLSLLLLLSLGRRANCLDVGANQGRFLRDMVRVAPGGTHIAYEPIPQLHRHLVTAFPAVDVRRKALSTTDGTTTFVHVLDPSLEGYSGLKRRPYPSAVETEVIEVETERLDSHLPEGWLPNFVKIDVEGAEGLVIAGALDTLRAARPTMVIEHGVGRRKGLRLVRRGAVRGDLPGHRPTALLDGRRRSTRPALVPRPAAYRYPLELGSPRLTGPSTPGLPSQHTPTTLASVGGERRDLRGRENTGPEHGGFEFELEPAVGRCSRRDAPWRWSYFWGWPSSGRPLPGQPQPGHGAASTGLPVRSTRPAAVVGGSPRSVINHGSGNSPIPSIWRTPSRWGRTTSCPTGALPRRP